MKKKKSNSYKKTREMDIISLLIQIPWSIKILNKGN